MIAEGRYTLVYPDGQYRTVKIKTWKKAQQLTLALKVGQDWETCAFVKPDGKLAFWLHFKNHNDPKRLVLIQKAMDRIMADPEMAGLSYAMKENRCYRCGKELTVPASIHKGMGPECAKRAVTKQLNQQAYQWRAGQGQPNPHPPGNGAAQGAPAVQKSLFTEADQQVMDTMVAVAEREHESRAFMSDPDMCDPDDAFWQEPCGICKRPRNQCSC